MSKEVISKSMYYIPERDTSSWIVFIQGKYTYGCEVSLIRKNNKHGQKSWGWGSVSKIIMFSTGKITKTRFNWMKKIAKIACNSLNEESV